MKIPFPFASEPWIVMVVEPPALVSLAVEANINNPMNSQTWSAPYQDSGVVGEVKISEKTDTKIKGTFNFKAKNSNDQSIKNITEGSFNLDFQ